MWRTLAVVLAAIPLSAGAQAPDMSRDEAQRLYAAGGFPISADGKGPRNACGQPAKPKISFLDVNGDGRRDALFTDAGRCYAPDGTWFAIAVNEAPGQWRGVGGFAGRVQAVGKDKTGWMQLVWTSNGRQTPLLYDGARYATAPVPPASPQRAATHAARDSAIFRAAGFVSRNGAWRSPDCADPGSASYTPGTIDFVRDVNGDGLPEALVIEGGTYCYGMAGQAFWLVGSDAKGQWRLMYRDVGIARFLPARGTGGWPDIEVGGPGFCFPILRWNGATYQRHRFAYEGKPCRR